MSIQDRIEGLFIGNLGKLPGGADSALNKRAVSGKVELTTLGLQGDTQVDRVHHGGPERALLHYCARHYPDWQQEFPQAASLFHAPGFGENLSSTAMDEDNVCIGDIYRIGTARIQVSQPRTPCWKLNDYFGVAELAARVQDSVRCGWLYRVLEPGRIAIGDPIELSERPHPAMTIATLMRAVYAPPIDTGLLDAIAKLAALSPNWRGKAERRVAGANMDSRTRLQGEPR